MQRLLHDGAEIAGVYTQPDRPSGRGRRLAPGPVKLIAMEHRLPVMQPESFRDEAVYHEFRALRPDIMVVAAYGQILPAGILDVPAHGCVNIHASLLPRWRGAAPVARAIEAGDATTGVSIMLMDAGLDTGGVIANSEIDVDNDDDAGTLLDKLATLGAQALADCLPDYLSGRLAPLPQDEAHATYARKLLKSEACLDWAMGAFELRNKIRALNPWPVAQTQHNENRIRILSAEMAEGADGGGIPPGSVAEVDKTGLVVVCGDGLLRLTRLQRDHGKPLAARDFLNGYRIARGDRLLPASPRDL